MDSMRHLKAIKRYIAFLCLLLASTLVVSSSIVQSDHIIRRKETNHNNDGQNNTRGIRMNMELTRSILVHQVDAPNLVCYNSTFPYLVSICDASNGYYCSNKSPIYGCTKETSTSCNEIHLCNIPFEIFVSVIVVSFAIILILITGLLWCCCCCCCGRCCKNTCPWFAKIQMHSAVIHSPNRVYPFHQDYDCTMYGYGGNRSPDTVMAKSHKGVKMENEQNQFFERDEFPPPPPKLSLIHI